VLVFSKLNKHFDRQSFDCGTAELNAFLKNSASSYIKRGLCAVHILSEESHPNTIIGYFSLSASAIKMQELPAEISKKYPGSIPVPCWLIGKLAVDRNFQGKGFGEILLLEAFNKITAYSKEAGGYCIVVDAKNEKIKPFYTKYGFKSFLDDGFKLFLPLPSIFTRIFAASVL
jgi:predicted GNAT family N-acyltransferase